MAQPCAPVDRVQDRAAAAERCRLRVEDRARRFQREVMEPSMEELTREAVPTVDLASGRIVADPPEGLLE